VLGTQLTTVAVPYQVYQLTHSSLDVGLWPGCCRASVSSGRRSDPGSKNGLTGLVRLSEPASSRGVRAIVPQSLRSIIGERPQLP
jgi:hypothetical protein